MSSTDPSIERMLGAMPGWREGRAASRSVDEAQSGRGPDDSQCSAASADPKQWGSTTGGGELGLAAVDEAQSGRGPDDSQCSAASADPKQWGSTTGGGRLGLGLAAVVWA